MDRWQDNENVGSILGLIAASIVTIVGCSASPMGPSADGLNLREPDAAFMKRVERDPFPRAEQAQLKR